MKRNSKIKKITQKEKKAASQDAFQFKNMLHQRLKEVGFIALIAFSIFLSIALFTHHPADQGWSHSGTHSEIVNSAGYVGAYISDFLFYMLGYMGYALPIAVVYLGWIFLLKPAHFETKNPNAILLSIKCASVLLLFTIGCAFLGIHFSTSTETLPFVQGGVLGYGVSWWLTQWFNPLGATLLLAALFLTTTTLLTGFSWLFYGKKIGFWGVAQLKNLFRKRPAFSFKLEPRDQDEDEPLLEEASKLNVLASKKAEPEMPFDKPIQMPVITEPIISTRKPVKNRLSIPIKTNLSFDLLDDPAPQQSKGYTPKQLKQMSALVELKLKDFNVNAQVVAVQPGPVVTRFELQLAPGTKVSKVSNLAKDLARSMSVIGVRVVEVIEGKSVIGLELPNKEREMVRLKEILTSQAYDESDSPLTLGLGKDIGGHAVTANLGKMPHLLVAGTTGSGKSVGVNAMLLSLLYKSSPDQLRMILIDPKMLELSIYDDIPHLLTPVITDMKDATRALRWCVMEMERRYKLMAKLGVRNLAGFNKKVSEAMDAGDPILDPFWDPQSLEEAPEPLKPLPYIVVVADEFADMMMVVGKKVEELITRIAQKARAAGMHLILATQRPSVDVITGLIKANVPTRMAFQVSSKVDSRTILDQMGAEQLLGHGDMLYLPPGKGLPIRVHGAFVDDHEVHKVTEALKSQGSPDYIEGLLEDTEGDAGGDASFDMMGGADEKDALYDQAVQIVIQTRKASVSGVQRRLKIGYNRAARLIETMEAAGIVSSMGSNGNREVLVPEHVE